MQLDELGLPIGLPMKLYQSKDYENGLPTHLLGMSSGRSMIISAPETEKKKVLMLQSGLTVFLRFGWKNAIFDIQTHVLRLHSHPYSHYHLAIPEKIEANEIRASQRVAAKLDANVVNVSQQSSVAIGVITDLSAGGLKLISEHNVGVTEDFLAISVVVRIDSIRVTVKLRCQICNMTIRNEGKGKRTYLYGIKIVGSDEQDMIALHAFIYQSKLAELKAL